MSAQICIITIAGYGPWTLELGSDREHKLQSLQASLYASLQDAFSARGGLVFQNRADEFFALTNGMSSADHADALDGVRAKFANITLDAAVGCASTPLDASKAADAATLAQGGGVRGSTCGEAGDAMILHMDVDALSARRASLSPYEVTAAIYGLYAEMSSFFLVRNSLAFFMGGDNFMIIADEAAVHNNIEDFFKISDARGLMLNCGIGRGSSARKAASNATRSLDDIRKMRKGDTPQRIYEAP